MREVTQAVVVESQQISRRNRIRVGLKHRIQLLCGLGVASVLTVSHTVGEKFISLNAVFGIRQLAISNCDLASTARKSGIPKRLQSLHQRRIKPGFLCQFLARTISLNQSREPRPHLFRYRFFLGVKILRPSGIFGQIVKLRLGSINEVVILCLHPTQFAPVEMQARQKGFGIQAGGFHLAFCCKQRNQTAALHARWNIEFHNFQHRRHQVGQIDRISNRFRYLLRTSAA